MTEAACRRTQDEMILMCVRWIPVHVFMCTSHLEQVRQWAGSEDRVGGPWGAFWWGRGGVPHEGRNDRRTIRGKHGGKAKRRTRKNRRMGLKRRSNQSIVSFFVVFLFFQEFASCPTVQKFFFLFKSPSHTSHFLIFYFFLPFFLLLLLFCFSVCNNISLREKKEKNNYLQCCWNNENRRDESTVK